MFRVPAARCLSGPVSLSARTQRPLALICSWRSPSQIHIIKIIPQPSTKSLFVTRLAGLRSVKSSPITVSGTMAYSEDHSPWLVWREWFVNHYSAACKVRNTWGMQIMCHQTRSYAAKSEKLQLLLFQIGFFFFNHCYRACRHCLPFFCDLTQCVYFSCPLLGRQSLTALVTPQPGILGVRRKGNIRLRLLIDVNLNRQTDVWCVSNLPCRDILSCLEKHPIKAKLFLCPSPC